MAIVEQVHMYYYSNSIEGKITVPPGVTVRCEDNNPDNTPFINDTFRVMTTEQTLPPTQEYFSKLKIFHTASGTLVANANIHFYLDDVEIAKDELIAVYAIGDTILPYADLL